jgi:tetratricopeptide (TPR) repeat protein
MIKFLTVLIEKGGDGYAPLCPVLDIASQGGTLEEAENNLHETMDIPPVCTTKDENTKRLHQVPHKLYEKCLNNLIKNKNINRCLTVIPVIFFFLLGPLHADKVNEYKAVTDLWIDGFGEKALKIVDDSLTHDSLDIDLLCLRGLLYVSMTEYEKALNDFDKAKERNVSCYLPYSCKAIYYLNIASYNKAIENCNISISLKDDDYDAYFYRGLAYLKLGKLEECIDDFSKYIFYRPDYINGYEMRGCAYMLMKQYRLALLDFNKSIQLNPNLTDVYVLRAMIYTVGLRENSLAINDYTKALLLFDKRTEVLKQYYKDKDKDIRDYFMHNNSPMLYTKSDIFFRRGLSYIILSDKTKGLRDIKKAAYLGNSDAIKYLQE